MDGVFNISKGAFNEKFRDGATNGIVLLLSANETEADLIDHADLDELLTAAGNTEVSDASYARKTGITGTVTVDNINDRSELDMPDQTWDTLDGPDPVKAVTAYEESAADTGRVPISHHDFAHTTDGTDLTLEFNGSGVARAA